jgi:hypothetical protein
MWGGRRPRLRWGSGSGRRPRAASILPSCSQRRSMP